MQNLDSGLLTGLWNKAISRQLNLDIPGFSGLISCAIVMLVYNNLQLIYLLLI